MKLGEAIEILDDYDSFGAECTHPDLPDAIKLGKEALKLVDNLRFDGSPYYPNLLPGETED